MTTDDINQLIEVGRFPVACKQPELIETHISWVILCDEFVYKIKKPVHYSFLDFSTIQKRHHFCQEEIRLNWRLTFNIYLDIVPVKTNQGLVSLDKGPGKIIDYAIRMRRLPAERQMNRLVANHEVDEENMDRLAKHIAAFHLKAGVVKLHDGTEIGVKFNDLALEREYLLKHLKKSTAELVDKAIAISNTFLARHQQLLINRVERGYIRDVHGDLHARNVFLLPEPVIFDCIEFNSTYRQIDLLNEIAFMAMDLEAAGRNDLSQLFVDHYCNAYGLTLTEDETKLLNYFKMYRANVRAKVNCLRARSAVSDVVRQSALGESSKYLELMGRYFELVQ